METGINSLKDILQLIIGLVGAGSLAVAAYSYYLSKKQLNFAVIINCTERFQKIFPQLKSEDEDEKLKAVKLYVDLCNEELFYFKHKYLPDEIVDEWIDGMIYYLPHFKDGENVNEDENYLKEIVEKSFLHDYPRIRESFTVSKKFNLAEGEERKELVEIIKANLKRKNNQK